MDTNEEQRRRDLHAALMRVLDDAMKIDEAACGKIRVYNPESGTLEIRAQRGFSDGFVKSFAAVDPDDAVPCARAFRLRHRVTVPDVSADPQSAAYRGPAQDEGFKAMQVTPLIGPSGHVVGTLSTHFSRIHHTTRAAGLVLDYCSTKAAALIEAFILFHSPDAEQG